MRTVLTPPKLVLAREACRGGGAVHADMEKRWRCSSDGADLSGALELLPASSVVVWFIVVLAGKHRGSRDEDSRRGQSSG